MSETAGYGAGPKAPGAAGDEEDLELKAYLLQLQKVSAALEGLLAGTARLKPGQAGADKLALAARTICAEVEKSLPALREYLEDLREEERPGADALEKALTRLEDDLLLPLLSYVRAALGKA